MRRGDTFTGLAHRYNVSLGALLAANRERTGGRLRAGSNIVIPLNAKPASLASAPAGARRPVIQYVPALDTIVVRGRGADVTLTDITRVVDASHLAHLGDREWYLKTNLLIGTDVHLRLGADEIATLKLASNADRFVWLSTEGGRITIEGISVTSWDEQRQDVDRNIADGRSYLLARTNGRMDILHAEISHLGYALQDADRGGVYGASWRIAKDELGRQLVTGEVRNSRFHHNHFGAYTFGATAMLWQNNEFFDNDVYGLDPHDDSNHFLVEGNRAYRNGKHGIIFSKRCVANVIRNNEVFENGHNGIMLHEFSDRNLIADNIVTQNHDGVVVYQSRRNLVAGNTVRDNAQNIRLNGGGDGNVVRDNTVQGGGQYGIRLYGEANGNAVVNNHVSDTTAGLLVETSGNALVGNDVRRVRHGLILSGIATENAITRNTFSAIHHSSMLIMTDEGTRNFLGYNVIGRAARSIAIR